MSKFLSKAMIKKYKAYPNKMEGVRLAAGKILEKAGWCRDEYAKKAHHKKFNDDNVYVDTIKSPLAKCFCAYGAMGRAYHELYNESDLEPAFAALDKFFKNNNTNYFNVTVQSFNDDVAKNKKDVIETFFK